MSDEPQKTPPLSLRLKPRANPPPDAPPPVPAAPPEMPPEPDVAAPSPVLPSEPPAPVQPAPSPVSGGADLMKFRLKPKTPPTEPPPSDTAHLFSSQTDSPLPPLASPPPPLPAEPPPIAAPPPAAPPPVAPLPVFRAPPPKHLQSPPSLHDPAVEPSPPPTLLPTGAQPERAIKADKWLAAIVVLVIVIVGGTLGVRYLLKKNAKPVVTAKAAPPAAPVPVQATPAAPPPEAKPLPGGQTKLVDNPQSAAGKALAKARDTVAAVEKRELAQGTTSVLASEEAPPAAPQSAASAANLKPAEPEKFVLGPNTVLAPVVEELPADKAEVTVPATEAFMQFVKNLRVNGVFQGDNPRAMLNGKMYSLGMEVDAKLTITLYKIEPESKLLIFRDDTGATVSRRY